MHFFIGTPAGETLPTVDAYDRPYLTRTLPIKPYMVTTTNGGIQVNRTRRVSSGIGACKLSRDLCKQQHYVGKHENENVYERCREMEVSSELDEETRKNDNFLCTSSFSSIV